MNNQITTAQTTKLAPEQINRMLSLLSVLPKTPSDMKTQRNQRIAAIETLSKPIPRPTLQTEIMKIMIHYYIPDMPTEFASSIGEDYDHALREYPKWCIERARQWWIGKNNPNRRKKPLPGDLATVCDQQMAPILAARERITLFDKTGNIFHKWEKPPNQSQ